jgi:hypothetical protein
MKISMSHPVLAEVLNNFASTLGRPISVTVCEDFITSDYCTECEGRGWHEIEAEETRILTTFKKEQCFSCEELHAQELRADRLMDEAKGN